MERTRHGAVIRSAVEEDWTELRPLLVAMGKTGTESDVRRRFRQLFDSAEQLICVAADGGRLIGYAWAQDRGPHLRSGQVNIRLHDLYVDPAHRRSGVGRSLFERVTAWAQSRGPGWMEWQAPMSAAPFYERLGLRAHPDPDPEHPYFEIRLRRIDAL